MRNILSLQIPVEKSDYEKLPAGFYSTEASGTEEVGFWKASWRRLRENRIAMAALVVILIIIVFAVIGPMLSPYTYDEQVHGDENLWPCFSHPFGTDRLGRDLMVRCMTGTRISLLVGVVSAIIVMIIGSIYGSISGLLGGRADTVMMRIVDIIYSVPEILLIVVIKLVIDQPLTNLVENVPFFHPLEKLGSGLIAIFIVYGCLYWVGMARIVRGQVLQLKEMEYVTAAHALGAPNGWLIRNHLLPNCMGQIIATMMMQIPSASSRRPFFPSWGSAYPHRWLRWGR